MKYLMVLSVCLIVGCASTKPPTCKGDSRRPVNAGQQVGSVDAVALQKSFSCV